MTSCNSDMLQPLDHERPLLPWVNAQEVHHASIIPNVAYLPNVIPEDYSLWHMRYKAPPSSF